MVRHAHDGGHGPAITDEGKQGGVVAPVIDLKDVKKVRTRCFTQIRLVRSEDGTVRVYLYDKDMKPLDRRSSIKQQKQSLNSEEQKWVKNPFTLTQTDGAFMGKAPKTTAKPFNIDVVLKKAVANFSLHLII